MKVKVVEFFAAVKELQLHQVDDRPARLPLYNFLLRGGLNILEQYNFFIELIYKFQT